MEQKRKLTPEEILAALKNGAIIRSSFEYYKFDLQGELIRTKDLIADVWQKDNHNSPQILLDGLLFSDCYLWTIPVIQGDGNPIPRGRFESAK